MNAPAKIDPAKATAMDTFAQAFLKVQTAIRPAIKGRENGAFRGTKYADLQAVWEAVKEPLQANGFSIIQAPDFAGPDMWLTTTILHISGESMSGRYPLRPSKADPQGFGSALTYARRYSLSAMLGVVADDDDDGNAASAQHRPQDDEAHRVEPVKTVEDADVTEGVKNWCATQKATITAASRLPDLLMWLDENGGDWVNPHKPSALDRLKRKAPEAFEDLKRHYQAKSNFIQKGRATT